MTAPVRPSLESLINGAGGGSSRSERPSLESLIASVDDPMAKYHADFKSGALQQSVADRNAKDAAAVAATDVVALPSAGRGGMGAPRSLSDTKSDMVRNALATAAATGRDIPGVEAAQAGGRSLLRGQSYGDALKEIRGAEDELPTAVRGAARLGGATLATMALPGTAAQQGAGYGALSGLLGADPDQRLSYRVGRAAMGGAVGGAVGKVGELAGTALRAKMAPDLDANLVARDAARAAQSAPAYKAFRDLGTLPETQGLRDILDLPMVQTAIKAVRAESPSLAKAGDTDAALLDAVYKRVGSKAFAAQHNFESSEARDVLASAIEDAAQQRGGSYAAALESYRIPSDQIGAVEKSRNALAEAVSRAKGSMKADLTKSPAALEAWAQQGVTPEEQSGAVEGILGLLNKKGSVTMGRALGTPIVPHPSAALLAAPDLLATMGQRYTPTQRLLQSLFTASATPTP